MPADGISLPFTISGDVGASRLSVRTGDRKKWVFRDSLIMSELLPLSPVAAV
jgi:hypothetical protein